MNLGRTRKIAVNLAIAGTAPCLLFANDALRFQHHYVDRNLDGESWGQTALADVDHDGDLDFITGQRSGPIVWYEYQEKNWVRHLLGNDSPSDVGGVAMDVNRDGWADFVTGGAWYEHPGKEPIGPFKRHVFDASLASVHDIRVGDLDGDGKDDIVTMSDKNDLRWYKIPTDPHGNWQKTFISESVHSGISVGDMDGDGDLDIARSNIWLENDGNGKNWTSHRMTEPIWGSDAVPWQRNATQTWIADMNGDNRPDVVVTDGESRGARAAWLEAPLQKSGAWKIHYLPKGDDNARGAYHSLHVADFDQDGFLDVFTVEMEWVGGESPPRWFIWKGLDGKGQFEERVILGANLGGHEAAVGDVDGDGDLDICSKLWRAVPDNANGGRNHVDFMENLLIE